MADCDYFTDRATAGGFRCSLAEYCGFMKERSEGIADVVCDGALSSEHSFLETYEPHCFDAKFEGVWYDKGSNVCEEWTRLLTANGNRTLSSTTTRTFSGELDLIFSRTLSPCDTSNNFCGCDVSLDGKRCDSCRICERGADGETRWSYDCTNLADDLLFTCEERNALDFFFQAESLFAGVDEPVNRPPCDYFDDQRLRQYKCSLEEYCDWFVETKGHYDAECVGDLDGRHEIVIHYENTCQRPESSGTWHTIFDTYCDEMTTTITYDKFTFVKQEWSETYSRSLDVVHDRVLNVCESGTKLCSCKVSLNKQQCESCTLCGTDDTMAYDCSNLAPLLTKSCDGDELDFVFHADNKLPQHDPNAGVDTTNETKKKKKVGTPVAQAILSLTGIAALFALVVDLRKATKIEGHKVWIRSFDHVCFTCYWILCVLVGGNGVEKALNLDEDSCSITFHEDISECHDDDSTGRLLVLTFFPILYAGLVCSYVSSDTHRRLRKKRTNETVQEYMERLYAATPSKITLKMDCWHTHMSTGTYTNYDSFKHTLTTTTWTNLFKLTTHEESEEMNVATCRDSTTKKITEETLAAGSIFAVNVITVVKGDAQYNATKDVLIRLNENRDQQYTFSEDMDLGFVESDILLLKEKSSPRNDLHSSLGLLTHILVVLALPYRLWVNSQIVMLRPNVTKEITTSAS